MDDYGQWREVRCTNSFKGRPDMGGVCAQLLFRVGLTTRGSFEIKCSRCRRVVVVRVDIPAVAAST